MKKESLNQKIDRLENLIRSLQYEIQALRFQQPVIYPHFPTIWYGVETGLTTTMGKSEG